MTEIKIVLTDLMRWALMRAIPGIPLQPSKTRAALMRRGLVHDMEAGWADAGKLTPLGRQIRMHLIEESERRA